MKRIVYISPYYFSDESCIGGGERYPLYCARGVVAAAAGDCMVDVVSFAPRAQRQTIAPGVSLQLLPSAKKTHSWDVVSWRLPAAIAGADLVHIHQAAMRASEFALLIAKQQRIPVCVTDHGSVMSAAGIFQERLDLADRVVCYSEYGASLLETRTPKTIVKGGVDTEFFVPPKQPLLRDRVLYVGRIVPHKGIDRLIQALPPELPLTVCGRSGHNEYFRLLQKLAQGKQVQFVQDADDATIRALYWRAWANVLPTVYRDCYGTLALAPELMGLTLLEAMACGTPALCSKTGGMPEFVRSGETGYVYRTLEELTDELRYLARTPTRVEALGRQARIVVKREYSLDVVGVKLWELYLELMRSKEQGFKCESSPSAISIPLNS